MTTPAGRPPRAEGEMSREARNDGPSGVALHRTLGVTSASLYGLGVTIGAGIYVLIGPAAGRAGLAAPLAFVVAAVLMALTAASFAELGGRMPVAAGEAAYIGAGWDSPLAGKWAGLLVVAIAIVSAAAISVGSAGYIRVFVPAPAPLVIAGVVLAMGAIAAWGIKESVTLASLMTLVEIGGLLLIIAAGFLFEPAVVSRLPELAGAGLDPGRPGGLMAAALIAVFAFIGFEAIVNIAEEVKEPARTLPRAIFLTLALTTALYFLVVWVALVAVPLDVLARSQAPLALVFERLTGWSPRVMSAIAVVATLNGVIVQIIMGSRVVYGLASQRALPRPLAEVSPVTRTPLAATLLVIAIVMALALTLPLDRLADWTSRITLALFALVNVALVRIKAAEERPPPGVFIAPRWVPIAGALSCVAFLFADALL